MANEQTDFFHNLDKFNLSTVHQCTPELAHSIIPTNNNNLKLLSLNIRSINRNFLNFLTLQSRLNLSSDILVFTECWLPCLSNSIIPTLDNYTTVQTNKHLNQNDGVVVYLKSNLPHTSEELNLCGMASGLLIKLGTDSAIICIYRSPSTCNIDNFLNALDKIFSSLSNFKSVILVGDINVDITPASLDARSHSYLNRLAYHGLLPAHDLPTREDSCLDHIMMRSRLPSQTIILDTNPTDHNPILFILDLKPTRNLSLTLSSTINYNNLDKDFEKLDLTSILSMLDPETATNVLISNLSNIITTNTTTKTIPKKHRIKKPWITPGLLRCIRNRDRLHRQSKTNQNNEVFKKTYIRYRNFCTNLLKKLKRQFESSELQKAGKNSKLLWNTIKKISNTTQPKSIPSQLILPSLPTKVSCNNVNSFFVNIGKNLADDLIKSSQSARVCPSLTPPSTTSSFALIHTDPDEIITAIRSLKPHAATGWDGISSVVLKRYSNHLAPILSHIFNLCFEHGVFPSALKKAIIHPIFKSGDRSSPNNYRPIAVLPSLSKILERLINWRFLPYLENNNLISPNQFGFRRNISTSDALLRLTNTIVNHLNNNKKALAIFLDLAKAFDTVPIPALLNKLSLIGVRGAQHDLFRSYLSERLQMVKIGECLSDELEISYGVPQGSILGPILFLVFINDLCNISLTNGSIITYADDTVLLFDANTWIDIQVTAQTGFNTIHNWLLVNSLSLNTSKTKFIPFSVTSVSQPRTSLIIKAHLCHQSYNHSNCVCPSIAQTDTIKYLGIILDKHLTFKPHIETLTSRLRKLMYVFKSIRNVAASYIIKMTYHALAESILTYCIPSWGGAAKTFLQSLEIAQRGVLKVATKRPIHFPTTELYKLCDVLTVRQLFVLKTNLLQHHRTPYDPILKRRKDLICHTPFPKLTFTKRHNVYLGPYLYNKINKILPIHQITSYECNLRLTKYLKSLSYDDTEKLVNPFN